VTAAGPIPASPAPRPPLRGFFWSAAFMDGGFFLILTAMPFKVLDLGGGALELGLVAAIGAVSYIAAAPLAGRWSDRTDRRRLCLGGVLVVAVASLLAWWTRSLPVLLALQVLMGLGKSLYWPAVEATLADVTDAATRLPAISRLNVAWSTGKTLGFAAGGVLLARLGFHAVYLTGAAAVIMAFLLLPRRVGGAQTGEDRAPGDEALDMTPAEATRWRHLGWVANTAAYGALGILTHHLPQWFAARGWPADRYGWYLALILASQTVVFLLIAGRRRVGWTRTRLWTPQLLGAAAVAAVPLLGGFGGVLATAPVFGLACGVCYTASIYFSLAVPTARGQHAGIHEALVGAGGFLPPLLAGLLVRLGAGLAAPYALAAALLVLGLGVQAALARRTVAAAA
jgi:MFS family permease